MTIPKLRCSSRRGFTIVELLVVVAIIIVLAALAFTMAGRGQKAAKSAGTLANLREIGVGVAGWMSDNNQFFPPAWDNTSGRNQSYAQVLDPYVNGEEDYRKPDSRFIAPNARMPVEVNDFPTRSPIPPTRWCVKSTTRRTIWRRVSSTSPRSSGSRR